MGRGVHEGQGRAAAPPASGMRNIHGRNASFSLLLEYVGTKKGRVEDRIDP